MAVFRRLVFAALAAGLLSGIFAAVAHQIGTVPLILEAETYENSPAHAMAPSGPPTLCSPIS
jgi:predicted cobalt transporter CbtA